MTSRPSVSPAVQAQRPARGSASKELLAAAAAAFAALVALSGQAAVDRALQAQSEEVVVRAVLRYDVAAADAEALAASLIREEPGLKVAVVGPEEGRARLALQEDWMRNLPEVELVELPSILEARHPQAVALPDLIAGFRGRLEQRPEVQFVEFNTLGYDALVRLAQSAGRAAFWIAGAVTAGVALLYLIVASVLAARRGSRVRKGAATVVGCAGGLAAGWALAHWAMASNGFAGSPGLTETISVGIGALIVRGVGGRLKRRKSERANG